MNVTALAGEAVFSPEGKPLGYVKTVYVDKNFEQMSSFLCVGEEEEEFVLPAQAYRGGKITAGGRLRSPLGVPCPVGRAVFDGEGALLGAVCGLDLDEGTLTAARKGCKLVLPLSHLSFLTSPVLSSSPVEREKVQKKRTRPHKNATSTVLPKEETPRGRDLLGRTVKRTVFCDGTPLALAGETVTPALLERARARNKLLELAANTITRPMEDAQ